MKCRKCIWVIKYGGHYFCNHKDHLGFLLDHLDGCDDFVFTEKIREKPDCPY